MGGGVAEFGMDMDTRPYVPWRTHKDLDEVLPGGKAGHQPVPPGPGVGDGDVQAAVGQLVRVGRENRLHSAPQPGHEIIARC